MCQFSCHYTFNNSFHPSLPLFLFYFPFTWCGFLIKWGMICLAWIIITFNAWMMALVLVDMGFLQQDWNKKLKECIYTGKGPKWIHFWGEGIKHSSKTMQCIHSYQKCIHLGTLTVGYFNFLQWLNFAFIVFHRDLCWVHWQDSCEYCFFRIEARLWDLPTQAWLSITSFVTLS